MKIARISAALRKLSRINDEIDYAACFDEKQFTGGVIVFRPSRSRSTKQIRHTDRDVVCHVLQGRGRLRINKRRIALGPGILCHIPKGMPHDFAAGRAGTLVLFYLLIRTGTRKRNAVP